MPFNIVDDFITKMTVTCAAAAALYSNNIPFTWTSTTTSIAFFIGLTPSQSTLWMIGAAFWMISAFVLGAISILKNRNGQSHFFGLCVAVFLCAALTFSEPYFAVVVSSWTLADGELFFFPVVVLYSTLMYLYFPLDGDDEQKPPHCSNAVLVTMPDNNDVQRTRRPPKRSGNRRA